jgi:hypothetical protein
MCSHKRYVWRRLVQTGVESAAAAGVGLVAADADTVRRGGSAERVPPPEGLLGAGAAAPVASTGGRRPQRHQHHHQDDAQQVSEHWCAVRGGFLRADHLGHAVQALRERGGGQIDAEGVVEAGAAVQVEPLEAHREVLGRRPRQTLARSHFGRASLQSSLFLAIRNRISAIVTETLGGKDAKCKGSYSKGF